MNQNELDANQTFGLLALACTAGAVIAGLVLRKVNSKSEKNYGSSVPGEHPFDTYK